jgi:hypothetical protein
LDLICRRRISRRAKPSGRCPRCAFSALGVSPWRTMSASQGNGAQ